MVSEFKFKALLSGVKANKTDETIKLTFDIPMLYGPTIAPLLCMLNTSWGVRLKFDGSESQPVDV